MHDVFNDKVPQKILQALVNKGFKGLKFDADKDQISVEMDGSAGLVLMLSNLRAEYNAAKEDERGAVIERFASAAHDAARVQRSDGWEDVKRSLLPIVRSRIDSEVHRLGRNMVYEHMSGVRPEQVVTCIEDRLTDELVVGIAVDMPDSTLWATNAHLERWGVSKDAAMTVAMWNLRKLHEKKLWTEIAPGLWEGHWNDSYETSRILMPEVFDELLVKEPVIMAPLRHRLYAIDPRSQRALGQLGLMIIEELQTSSRWLSTTPLQLTKEGWKPFKVPSKIAPIFEELSRMQAQYQRDAQSGALKGWLEREGKDIFIASFQQLVMSDDSGVQSMASLTQGVDTFLPRTDLVALLRLNEKDRKPRDLLVVRWEDMEKYAGNSLERTDFWPEMFRATSFPSDKEFESLRKVAVTEHRR